MTKAHGESDDGHVSSKNVKMPKVAAGKTASSAGKNSPSHGLVMMNKSYGNAQPENQIIISGTSSNKKSADTKTALDSTSLTVSNGDASLLLTEAKDAEKLKTGVSQSKNTSNKLKDAIANSDASNQMYHDQNANAQSKFQSGKVLRDMRDLEQSIRPKEKNCMQEVPESKNPEYATVSGFF